VDVIAEIITYADYIAFSKRLLESVLEKLYVMGASFSGSFDS